MCRQRSFHTHYSRLVDDSPAPNIQSCVFVRERSVPAGLADKLGLAPAIGLIAIPALATGTRSVARSNRCKSDPAKDALYSIKARSSPKAHLPCLERCARLTVVRWRMPCRSSRHMPLLVSAAFCTSRLEIRWLVSRLWRRSRLESLLRWRLAERVPAF